VRLGLEHAAEQARRLVALGRVEQPDAQRAAADGCLQASRRSLGDDLAAVDDRDAVGELIGLVEVLGAEQHRRAQPGEGADDVPHLVARARVQARGRLVEEHELGRDDDARREIQAPAHAAGEVLHEPSARLLEAEGPEQLVGPYARRLRSVAEQPAEQDEVLPGGQVVVDRGELAGQADEPAHGVGLGHDVVPEHPRAARVGTQERGEHPDRRRLAGAVGPEHAVHGAALDGQVDAVDGARRAKALDEPGRFDGEGGGHGTTDWGGRANSSGASVPPVGAACNRPASRSRGPGVSSAPGFEPGARHRVPVRSVSSAPGRAGEVLWLHRSLPSF